MLAITMMLFAYPTLPPTHWPPQVINASRGWSVLA
jgi:hypothetical protein